MLALYTLWALALQGPGQGIGSTRKSVLPVRAASVLQPSEGDELAWPKLQTYDDMLSAIRTVPQGYDDLMREHPLPLAAVQASSLRCMGDSIAQEIARSHGGPAGVDLAHMGAMGLIGLVFSGSGNFLWIHHLDDKMGSTRSATDVLLKTSLDFCCWAPIANCAYLLGVPLLTGAPPDAALLNAQQQFVPTMGTELSIFAPYNLLAFSVIPLKFRPACGALTSLLFTISIATRC
jgi:hypothetical protein